jgi:hypothetical protein
LRWRPDDDQMSSTRELPSLQNVVEQGRRASDLNVFRREELFDERPRDAVCTHEIESEHGVRRSTSALSPGKGHPVIIGEASLRSE